jgi:hypothetical protein
MKLDRLRRLRPAQGLLATVIAITLLLGARTRAQGPGNNPSHLPTDWSHRHMVFSPPTSFQQAWELEKEPRYWHQWARRNEWALRSANGHVESEGRDRGRDRDHDGDRDRDGDDSPAPTNDSMRRDWAMSLGANGTVGTGQFPAKFSFNVNAAPSCANDFIAFNTSLAGVSPTTAAKQATADTFPALSIGTPAGTFTITQGATSLVLTAAANNTGNNFMVVSNLLGGNATNAASLAARIVALGGPVGVTATAAGANVTVTALQKGIGGNSITVSSTLTNFTVGSTPLTGGVGTGNIVAFNQLYTSQSGGLPAGSCGTNGPSVYWSYFTGTGTAVTSMVLSIDGTKVAFVENVGGTATLRLLKWKSGEGTGAGYPVAVDQDISGANWSTCTAGNSCIASIAFSGTAATDTKSPPFYNYATDELYVGNDNGVLHKFTGVFLGTPAEVGAAGSWPITVDAGTILTGPVFDDTSKNIFVGDNTGHLSFVKEIGSITGACGAGSPPCLGSVSQALTGSIVDAPYVDASTGRVLVFDGTETTKQGSVFQFDTALTAGSKVTVGIGGNGTTPLANLPFDILHGGAFDDAYFSAGPGSGHLYTCGKDPGFNNRPAIYQLSFTGPVPGPAGVLVTTGIPASLTNLTTTFSLIGDACSPVTEIKNGATDRIFFSFATNANPPAGGGTATGCTAGQGCVASIIIGGAWPPAATAAGIAAPFILTGAQSGSGGTSGIVVDNVGVGGQESSIYYTYQTNSTAAVTCNTTVGVGCAVKVTQSTLQ